MMAFPNGGLPSIQRAPAGEQCRHLQARLIELRDLLYNAEQTGALIDEYVAVISRPDGGLSLVDASKATWKLHLARPASAPEVKWRLAEITDTKNAAIETKSPGKYELNALWESEGGIATEVPTDSGRQRTMESLVCTGTIQTVMKGDFS